jgi:colicin import membrane protein
VFRGLLTSFVGHALLLAYALISIHRVPPDLPETVTIEASIITPSELTRLKQGSPDSKELEAKAKEEPQPEVSKKEADKPKPVTAPPPPPPPEPEKVEEAKPKETAPKEDAIADKLAALPPPPEPDPGPTLAEKKKLEETLEQERVAAERKKQAEEKRKKAEAKKKAAEKKKKELAKKKAAERKKKLAEAKRKAEEAKKKQFDLDKIAALIDKSPDKRGAPRTATPPTKPTEYTGPTKGERRGTDTVLSAREADLLLSMILGQLRPCARLPGGGGGPDTPVVDVEFRLNPDGSLNGEPVIRDRQNSPLYRIAADAAVRAIKQCAPFQLPADKYAAWSRVSLIFDWPVMLGLVQR